MRGRDDLVLVPDYLRGWKAAHLIADRDGRVGFTGAMVNNPYGPRDIATCAADPGHVPPEPMCLCGFYAFHDRARAVGLLDGEAAALLQVQMWGRFEEYELGFIAAAQQVVSVELLPYCTPCSVGRESELVEPVAVGRWEDAYTPTLVPLCADHVQDTDQLWQLKDLSENLGVACRWADGEEELAELIHAARQARFPTPPFPRNVRRLDDLLPGETAHVFANTMAGTARGLWIDPLARLIQPMPGVDVPIRLGDDGVHEVLLDGIRIPGGFRARDDKARFALTLRAVGEPDTSAGQLEPDDTCECPNQGGRRAP